MGAKRKEVSFSEQLKEQDKKEKKIRCAYRWKRIKEKKCPWVAFALSFLIPIICLILKGVFPCPECSFTYKVSTWLENISYGYFSGFVVYLFISFFPETKKDVKTKDKIYFQLSLIWFQLDSFYHQFAPEGSKIDFRICQTFLYNYLVADARITDFNDEKQLLRNPSINKNYFNFIKENLANLSQSIDKLIMVFGHDMNSDEVDLLIDLSRAETELMNSVNEEDGHYKDGDLESFINYFSTKAYIQFHHIYHSYSFYNFCEAGIKLGNSD